MDIKHPEVTVRLTGTDGNVFSIIGRVAKAIQRAVGREEADQFRSAALECESYDAVLVLCMQTVNVD